MKAWFVALCLFLPTAACKPRDQGDSSSTKQGASDAKYADKKQGFPDEKRQFMYHGSQGAENVPYVLMKAATVKINDVGGPREIPFLSQENVRRYGLIPGEKSAINPEGLPIGLSLARSPVTGQINVGMNCALCHVGEIEVGDGQAKRKIRLDGGTNLTDVSGFFMAFANAVDNNLKTNPAGFAKKLKAAASDIKSNLGHIGNAGEDPASWSAIAKSAKNLLDVGRMVEMAYFYGKVLGHGFEFAKTGAYPGSKKLSDLVNSYPEKGMSVEKRKLLLAMVHQVITNIRVAGSGNENHGPGRTSAFSQIKDTIYASQDFWEDSSVGSVSIPSLYHVDKTAKHHWSLNSSSFFERNLANAIGLGALVDRYFLADEGNGPTHAPTYRSTMHVENVDLMERTYWEVAPPLWPEDVAPIDKDAVARGEQVYKERCRVCHEPKRNERGLWETQAFTLAEIGTDGAYYDKVRSDIALPGKTMDYGDAFSDVVDKMRKAYFASNPKFANDRKAQLAWEDIHDPQLNPQGKRTIGMWNSYKKSDGKEVPARQLDGIWASAPYLHNGSVPSLAELLKPEEQRTPAFYLGHRQYDLRNVGYVLVTQLDGRWPDARWQMNTRKAGNSNKGHSGPRFGTDLPEADKEALIEFLKTFGNGGSSPKILSGD